MTDPVSPEVRIRPWAEGDLRLLQALLGDPAMTEYIGGPEPPEKLADRHERYVRSAEPGGSFVVEVGADGRASGWVGYWKSEWAGRTVWEVGWSVLPDSQRQGVATAAMTLLVERIRCDGVHRFVDAFPDVRNAASNAVCRKLRFELLGEVEVEYPPGHAMRANHWRMDLGARRAREATSE